MSWNVVLESLSQPVINRYVDYGLFTLIVFVIGVVNSTQGFTMT